MTEQPLNATQKLAVWLNQTLYGEKVQLNSLSGDAGFRQYFRFQMANNSLIAVYAPPQKCNNQAFVDIQTLLQQNAINVPEILSVDLQQGFFCLQDLGNCALADVITEQNAESLYRQALQQLQKMAVISKANSLPQYDADFVAMELDIFSTWLLASHLQIQLTTTQQQALQQCFQLLIENAIEQPKVFMHRDYHSRNIMLVDNQQWVIDFQDAVYGALTYDAVSLLRDCYLKLPNNLVQQLSNDYRQAICQQLGLSVSQAQWQRWFDLMGIQRHLKAAGIFARLHHRDGKSHYLRDIPLTLQYIIEVGQQYAELQALVEFIEQQVLAKVNQAVST